MVTNISSLPPEILHEILGQPVLTRKDLYNASFVCKSFHEITREYISRDSEIQLRCNDAEQLTSFLRKLLANKSFGKNFTNVNIYTSTKVRYRKDASTAKAKEEFKWTPEELSALSGLYTKYSFIPRWISSIEKLTDPGSLLVPIICHLSNLQELSIADLSVEYELEGVYDSCMHSNFEEFITRSIQDDKKDIKDPEVLLEDFPPALKGLKDFSRGYHSDEVGFDIDSIIPILLLPEIESVTLEVFGGDFGLLDRFEESDFMCNLTTVKFSQMECTSEEVAKFFRFCAALEFVDVSLDCIGMDVIEDYEELEEKFSLTPMIQALIDCHRDTLKHANIQAERDYWWFKRKGRSIRSGRKPSWWGSVDWSDEDDE
ncbi:hypothetical protein ABW20_dc0104229 [Dactylellina cionopaga]|nr:hypothetical protein ABW20_dc0104229 [Dactylellina cionopaga]